MLVARAATAAPIATAQLDVDGDGAPEAVELGDDGVLHVRGGKLAGDLALGFRATRATLSAGPVAGRPALAVHAVAAGGERGFVVVHDRASWRVAWQDQLGPADLDGEYRYELAGTPAGVLRFQSRFGVARCDGKPAYLFADAFDGTKFERRRALPADVDPNAAKLSIKAVTDAAAPPLVYRAFWTSDEVGASDASALSRPTELDDGSLQTAWHGDPAVDGDGQFVTFKASSKDAHAAHQLRIAAGDHASAGALARAARPKQLAIVTATGAWRVDLPDAAHDSVATEYLVDLPAGISDCVTVVVAATYPGAQPLAISELAIYADNEGDSMLVHDVATDAPGANSEAAALVRLGGAAVPAIRDELAKSTEAGARQRLIDVLVQIHDHDAATQLAAAAAQGWVSDDEAPRVAAALADQHMTQALHDLASVKAASLDMRLAAAGALDATSQDGAAALIELAGSEPRELRRVVIGRLEHVALPALVAAARVAQAPASSGDLWRAAVREARGSGVTPADRAAALAAMRDALPNAPDYERRYRLVDGIATLGDAKDLAALATTLGLAGAEGSFQRPEAIVLRQVALLAIGAAPRADALDFVVAAIGDADPGVRLGALRALQAPDDDRGGPWGAASVARVDRSLIGSLANDRWPEVRERAAEGLGLRCQRGEPAHALVTAVTTDAELDVRRRSLVALVQCRAPGTADLIAKLFDDDKLPLELRAFAISQTISLEDPALAAKLVQRFDSWRGNSLQDKDSVQLAMEAANAIGRLHAQGAAGSLEDALDDSAFPEIVGAAAAGLGSLGKACPASAKHKLEDLAKSDDQQVRLPARRAAAACGK